MAYGIWAGLIAGLAGLFSGTAQAADWLLVGQHYHTTTDVEFSQDPSRRDPKGSYRVDGIRELLERGAKLGLDAMVVTEHNAVATCFDRLFQDSTNKVTLICGEEWTNKRSLHLGLINPPVSRDTDGYVPRDADKVRDKTDVENDARELVRAVHAGLRSRGQTGLAVINHPGFEMYRPADSLGADAAEVVVPEYEDAVKTRLWWMRRLAAGERLVALGGSDFHACQGWDCLKRGDYFRTLFSEPVNLVYADSAAPADVVAAMARGRVVALAGAKYAKLRVELFLERGERDGRTYAMGDVVEGARAGDLLKARVRILNGEGLFAVVYGVAGSGGKGAPFTVAREIELASDAYDDVLELKRGEARDAIHVEVFEPEDWASHSDALPIAVSNPIYF
ncbi:MAG: hypothetical protein HY075_14055 [Deltaproteobacteria bacterium]|nr:hypothetical protein [Deltaproteobacteria bacterium]